jgi:hypothetical protein
VAVQDAVEWALGKGGRATALAELALSVAREIEAVEGAERDKPPPVAQLAKELRATLEDLEGLRDSDDAEASLGVVLSSPVWDSAESG